MKRIMSIELPLVLLSLMLLYLATCVLGQSTGTCEPCDCSDVSGHIRFTDPSRNSSAGQIQVCYSNYWQTVCGAKDPQQQIDLFSDTDANVACFQLGFIGGHASEHLGLACKLDSPSYLVVDTPCKGWEEKLSDCNLQSHTSGPCTHRTAVNVTCEPIVQVQLVHKNTSSYFGRVMQYFNNSWRTVCDKNWIDKMSNSDVLCQQLGLGHALEHWLHHSNVEDVHFLQTDMDCTGTEDKLRLCKHNFTTTDTCNGKSVPWVVCSGPEVSDFELSSTFTSITLHWSVPEALKYYPVVKGYNVSHREKEAKDGGKVALGLDQQEVTLGGLQAGTQYYVTVLLVLEDDRPGPAATFVVSTTTDPSADPAVVGLASGLAVCGALLIWVLVAAIAALIGVLKQRRPLGLNPGGQAQYEEIPQGDAGDPAQQGQLAIEMGPDNPQGGEGVPLVQPGDHN